MELPIDGKGFLPQLLPLLMELIVDVHAIEVHVVLVAFVVVKCLTLYRREAGLEVPLTGVQFLLLELKSLFIQFALFGYLILLHAQQLRLLQYLLPVVVGERLHLASL